MINPQIIDSIFSSASIQRWNDYPRMMELVELDKQAHKFIIAYFIAKLEDEIALIRSELDLVKRAFRNKLARHEISLVKQGKDIDSIID
jgi:competence protein ComGF